MIDLTKRQQEIYEYIKKYLSDVGYPPTVREIGKAVGLTSSSTVHAHLANLEKYGILKRSPSKPRALELLLDKARGVVGQKGLPLVGSVAAGQPILAEENIEDYVVVPGAIRQENGEFVLRVKGDSMKDAGILNGDYVVVRPTQTAANGEIVVAILEDEGTVKRFYKENGKVRLQPENERLEPILVDEVEIAGRVIGVYRTL